MSTPIITGTWEDEPAAPSPTTDDQADGAQTPKEDEIS